MTEQEQISGAPGDQQTAAAGDPTADQAPAADDESSEEERKAADNASAQPDAPPKRQPTSRRPQRSPAQVAGYFTACPRCSFFLAGYRLIYQDFDEVAANSSGDWLDLSWNLAVRNLVAKSYGYEMADSSQIVQGVCPECKRAFILDRGEDESSEVQFSIQINPR